MSRTRALTALGRWCKQHARFSLEIGDHAPCVPLPIEGVVMDPNATLAEIKRYVRIIENDQHADHYASELAYEVTNLLEWLAKGGFAPDWTRSND